MVIWQLKAGSDRRFKQGHPWVYSNELSASPKHISPGEIVELRDAHGQFLARGYGNPSSLIAFRELSRDENEQDPTSVESITRKLQKAWHLRKLIGLTEYSCRICFGEADGLPGLIIDRYLLTTPGHQIFSIQFHTAGMDSCSANILKAVSIAFGDFGAISIIVHNDMGVRKLEGLQIETPKVVINDQSVDFHEVKILVQPASGKKGTELRADLIDGQKTGLFLDQALNVRTATSLFSSMLLERGVAESRPVRILDLFCYVGQWSAKFAHFLGQNKVSAHVTAVDASASALSFAKKNIENYGATVDVVKRDILAVGLSDFKEQEPFDLIICDPPALVKSRRDLKQGIHAYSKVNKMVGELLSPAVPTAIVSCSCSRLLSEEDFTHVLNKIKPVSWLGQGSQSPDHFILASFPEGQYLKARFGLSPFS